MVLQVGYQQSWQTCYGYEKLVKWCKGRLSARGDFVDDFSKEEVNMIENNDTTLNVVGYFNDGYGFWWGLVLPCVGLQIHHLYWLDVLIN